MKSVVKNNIIRIQEPMNSYLHWDWAANWKEYHRIDQEHDAYQATKKTHYYDYPFFTLRGHGKKNGYGLTQVVMMLSQFPSCSRCVLNSSHVSCIVTKLLILVT